VHPFTPGGTLIRERVVRIDAARIPRATIKEMTPTKLNAFWKNLVSLSFEKLTIVTRAANGRHKVYRFASGYEMITFYEKCAGVRFGPSRLKDSQRLPWRSI